MSSFGKNILSSAIGSTIGFLVASAILFVIFILFLFGIMSVWEPQQEQNMLGEANVLEIRLDAPIVERGSNEYPISFSVLGGLQNNAQLGLDQILEAFDQIAQEDQIKGVLLKVDDVSIMPSMMEDLRKGIEMLKDEGKFVVAWSENMSQKALHLNSAADEVYMHPQGTMLLNGYRSQSMFYPGMFEKLGIDVTVVRGPDNKYKSAVEPFLRKDFSPENREQIKALLEGFWYDMSSDVESSRHLEEGTLDDLANRLAIRSPEDAVNAQLLDGVLYEDELEDLLESKLGGVSPEFMMLGDYIAKDQMSAMESLLMSIVNEAEPPSDDETQLGGNVALIYAVGGIESGEGDRSTIGSETLAGALKAARLADDVQAVVLRVNSPGGSALASDVIWRETILLKEAGKPFVVSMSDMAASGGYYISCAADHIFANATTITGSIGVFGMIPNLGGMLEKHVGISFDEVSLHDHAGQPDGLFAPDEEALEAINERISQIYEEFTTRVAEGRGMTKSQVEEVARGRVWTGQDALEVGLVDEIGDLESALAYAANLAGMDQTDIAVVVLPEANDSFEEFLNDMSGDNGVLEALGMIGVEGNVLEEIWQVRRMIDSGDPVQARLPFFMNIN